MVAKSWVVSSLLINDQEAAVVQAETNIKLKADFDKDTHLFRLFYPGAIQFSDSDYQESKGSRLATDMGMSKVPDQVLYENVAGQMQMEEDETKLILQSSDDSYGDVKLTIQLASKWSLNDLCKMIRNSQASS
ncbi:unnamed protein product [Cylindrotheca closterium]|uniref:Uncharacterized protein n=1 Tax=Cylindrotheca closterium TaxID=2856 RepID=A0AAD2JI63_9STRA|nr:unnamed protein product [Cylindrotheca closterium]